MRAAERARERPRRLRTPPRHAPASCQVPAGHLTNKKRCSRGVRSRGTPDPAGPRLVEPSRNGRLRARVGKKISRPELKTPSWDLPSRHNAAGRPALRHGNHAARFPMLTTLETA